MIHRKARARVAGLIVAGTAIAVVVPGASATTTATAAPDAVPGGPTVTLLTGDRVTLGGPHGVSVDPAPGREHVGFSARKDEQGDVQVVPNDALALLSAGRLDPRLFDVTELARDGFDDTARTDVPLIVDYPAAAPASASVGATVVRELGAIGATALRADKSGAFWPGVRSSAQRIWLDGKVTASLDHSVPQIGAPAAWEAGFTGAGTTVAVLDTGIDTKHPDLSDAVSAEQNFSDAESVTDMFGHGTHVASIITGSGAADGGKYKGVAPDAKLLNGKVLNDGGSGAESWIIAGMEWAAKGGADVINMSLGSSFPSDGKDPMSQAVNRLTEETGALFVISAGNSGGAPGSPGAADAALTVGAVDREDKLADFSSRGPRWGDEAVKPEITAPGVDIVAARGNKSEIGDPVGDSYMKLSGTSMAAPHVAGAAAIMASQHPDWTATQLKSSLVGSAKPTEGVEVDAQGAGRVDVAAATTSSAFATPSVINNGVAAWPHDDDQPIANTVTYHNSGTEPLTLDVAADVRGPDGATPPEGMFTVEPAQVTVPAGGEAAVTVTTNTKVEAPDGRYTGTLVATGGDSTVRTPVSVTREVESYDVTLHFVDHNGAATDQYGFRFVDHATPKAYLPYDPSGTVVARVPKGSFYFEAYVQTKQTEERYLTAQYVEPRLEVTGDAEYTIDARTGKPIGFTTEKPDAKTGGAVLGYDQKTAWGDTGLTAFLNDFTDMTQIPATTKDDGFTFFAEATLAKPDANGGFNGSPYQYHLRETVPGTVPAELQWTVADKDLAPVRAEAGVATSGLTGQIGVVSGALPFGVDELYTPGVPWQGSFLELTAQGDVASSQNDATARTFELGEPTTVTWNKGVFGPAFPVMSGYPGGIVGRLGDLTIIDMPMFADQGRTRAGYTTATGTSVLLRDGQEIARTEYPGGGRFTLPPEEAKYTLRTEAARDSRLSTKVSGEWTFGSAHVPGENPKDLPMLAVRFAPKLDENNAAPAGKFEFPVYVQRADSGDPVRTSEPKVEISYDDGATWQSVSLRADGSDWIASVEHPAGAQFASLRTSVSDSDGNAASYSIVRAYALK
jgi:subtilisin family serine protease